MHTASVPKVYKRTIDAKPNEDSIVKPGELIDIVETDPLTFTDRRIYNQLIANAWDRITEPVVHQIPKHELQNTLHKGTERLEASIRRLMLAMVYVRVQTAGKWETKRVQLLGGNVVPDADDGYVRYDFHSIMREIITESTVFARLQKKIMFAISSKYSLALYELVQKRCNMVKNFEDFTVVQLRGYLGVPEGKLAPWINFKNRALTPAITEISALSDYVVTVEPLKRKGRLITHVRMTWIRKPGSELNEVMRELDNVKLGRKARLRGKVEHVGFGEDTSRIPPLRADTIRKAKAILPGLDIYSIEAEWREWAAGKPMPDSPDGAFLAFCKQKAERSHT